MKTLKFVKGPGYLYDLITMFVLYFNQEWFFSNAINKNKFIEDSEHFHQTLNMLERIPEELSVFFHLRDNYKCFFSLYYYHRRIDQILSDSGVKPIQALLRNHDEVIRNVAEYYLNIDTADLSPDDPQFFRTVGKLIRDSEYSTDIKKQLYEFFLDPIPAIQTLSTELVKKEVLLAKMYNENDGIIAKTQNNLDLEKLETRILNTKQKKINVSSFKEIIISICALQKNRIGAYTSEEKVLIILGTSYEEFSDYLHTKDRLPELTQFGIALSEENRIQILEFIHKKGEASVQEIRNDLKMSHTNAYYHITLLLKSNLLTFKNRGRTLYYSIDHQYFDDVCTMLSKFKQEGGSEP